MHAVTYYLLDCFRNRYVELTKLLKYSEPTGNVEIDLWRV